MALIGYNPYGEAAALGQGTRSLVGALLQAPAIKQQIASQMLANELAKAKLGMVPLEREQTVAQTERLRAETETDRERGKLYSAEATREAAKGPAAIDIGNVLSLLAKNGKLLPEEVATFGTAVSQFGTSATDVQQANMRALAQLVSGLATNPALAQSLVTGEPTSATLGPGQERVSLVGQPTVKGPPPLLEQSNIPPGAFSLLSSMQKKDELTPAEQALYDQLLTLAGNMTLGLSGTNQPKLNAGEREVTLPNGTKVIVREKK